MKQYEVFISDRASKDMDVIYEYIAETLLNPMAASNQYDRLVEAILSLETMPERIRLMYSELEKSKGLHPLLVDNYTVFYLINNGTVNIVRVLYSSSDISKRLSEEL